MKNKQKATKKVATKRRTAKTKKVSRTAAVAMIKNSNGKMITVTFVKNNGEQRTINGNYRKAQKSQLGYLTVYSMKDGGYRTVNTRTIKSVKANKTTYVVK